MGGAVMKVGYRLAVVLGGLLAAIGGSGQAAAESSLLSEIKGGVLVHDVGRNHESKFKEEDTVDLNLELLSRPIRFMEANSKLLAALVQPRFHLGGEVNTSGWTNQAYAGLTWDYRFDSGFFAEFAFGFTAHDGKLKARRAPDGRPSLGSPVLFREGLDLGYRVGGHSLAVHGSHISNGGVFAKENDGMNFLGLRYGYRFD